MVSQYVSEIKEELDIEIRATQSWQNCVTRCNTEINKCISLIKSLKDEEDQKSQMKQKYEDLCNLYSIKAELLTQFNQFKTAHAVYKESLEDPVCRESIIIWNSYLSFYTNRNNDSKARIVFRDAVQCLKENDKEDMISKWLTFEHQHGNPSWTQNDLQIQDSTSVKSSNVSETTSNQTNSHQTILQEEEDKTENDEVLFPHIPVDTVRNQTSSNLLFKISDLNIIKEVERREEPYYHPPFELKRAHRPICLFQNPRLSLEQMSSDADFRNIPTPILYALGCILVDQNVFCIIAQLRKMQDLQLKEIDNNQKTIANKWKPKTMTTERLICEKQYNSYMHRVYEGESKQLEQMIEYQQQKLADIGIPGFYVTREKQVIEIQRHILKLIELTQQKIHKEQDT